MRHTRFWLLLAVILLVGVAVSAQQTLGRVVGGDDAELREFILQSVSGPDDNAVVTIASLPDDLPFELSLPEETTLLGSISRIYEQNNNQRSVQVLLTTEQDVETAMNFYADSLQDNWQQTNFNISKPGGFNTYANGYSMYCYNDGEAAMNVDVYGKFDATLRLNIYVTIPAELHQCTEQGENTHVDPVAEYIPVLRPVDGVTIRTDIGGPSMYGTNIGSVSAVVSLEIPLADAFAAYSGQLADAGWSLVSEEINGRSVLSHWTIAADNGETWLGTFTIYENAGNENFSAFILIEKQLD